MLLAGLYPESFLLLHDDPEPHGHAVERRKLEAVEKSRQRIPRAWPPAALSVAAAA